MNLTRLKTALPVLITVAVLVAWPGPDTGESAGEIPGQGAAEVGCHSSYEGACLNPNSYDYDCEGGAGDGPDYTGEVSVIGDDPFELDRDGDGSACEPYW